MAPVQILKRFSKDVAALAAVEFAFVLPILVALLVGSVELYDLIDARRRVTSIASTIGDLTAQAKTIDNEDMENIFTAAQQILSPLESENAKFRITSVSVNLDDSTIVGWSDGFHILSHSPGEPFELPEGIGQAGSSVIVAEVQLEHRSMLGLFFQETFNFSDTFFVKPRLTLRVGREN